LGDVRLISPIFLAESTNPATAELGEADSVLSCRMAQYSTLRCEGFSLWAQQWWRQQFR